jgi:hypothetical protein
MVSAIQNWIELLQDHIQSWPLNFSVELWVLWQHSYYYCIITVASMYLFMVYVMTMSVAQMTGK